jgi:hypothetical protein
MSEEIVIGTKVIKHTGDYQIEGIVVASFLNHSGRTRYVVEHPVQKGAIYHIYSPENVRPTEE